MNAANYDDLLSKLQCALDEEISYIKNECKSYSIEVLNGTLVAHMGDSYIYLFDLNTTLPPMEDSEVNISVEDIVVSGTIVRLQGFEIEIMVRKDFGKSISKAKISFEPTWLLEKLLERLVELKNDKIQFNKEMALNTFFLKSVTNINRISTLELTPLVKKEGKPLGPRNDQLEAIKHSLALDISFVWGPPGTGKTTTLAWMVESLVKQGKKVLVVAHANVAVDNATEMIVDLLHDHHIVKNGQIIRFPRFRYTKQEIRQLADFEVVCSERTKTLGQQIKALRDVQCIEDLQLRVLHDYLDAKNAIEKKKREIETLTMNIKAEKKRLVIINREIGLMQEQLISIDRKLDKAISANKIMRFLTGLNPEKLKKAKSERIIEFNNIRQLKQKSEITIKQQLKQQTSKTEEAKLILSVMKSPTTSVSFQCNGAACGNKMKITLSSSEGSILCSKCGKSYKYKDFTFPQKILLSTLENQINIQKTKISEIEQKINEINEEINSIKDKVLSDSRVIATTLTKMHIAAELYNMQYDAIVLDEASMAPLPSIFFTAGLSSEKYIIFGDFCQLGPICRAFHSPENECQNAKQWLSKDIYLKTGIVDSDLRLKNKQRVKSLTHQSRMITSISNIIKKFVYHERGLILNDVDERKIHAKDRIKLYDTSQWNPWCSRSINWSHFNVRQAMLALGIAKSIALGRRNGIKNVTSERRKEDKRKVTIITPYREQARLLKTLLDAQDQLKHQIIVSSIYQFQGRETNRLILDFVDGYPLRFVGKPFQGTDGVRLLNVALSRARNEIHIICNYNYFKMKSSKNSKFCLEILDHVRKNHEVHHISESTYKIDADRVIQADKLLNPYAQNNLPEKYGLFTHKNFDPQFRKDIEGSKEHIVICSPFLTDRRVAKFMDLFYAKAKQGVKIGIYTRKASRQSSFSFGDVKQTIKDLRNIGVKVLESTKTSLHEKLIVFDDLIVWDGSLNALSYGGHTSESMVRIGDYKIVAQYKRLHGLDDFFERINQQDRREKLLRKLNAENIGFCPKCSQPMKAIYSSRIRCFAYVCSSGDRHKFQYVPGNKLLSMLDEIDTKCPKCGNPMVSRTIQKGKQLLGCSGYPECRYILNF